MKITIAKDLMVPGSDFDRSNQWFKWYAPLAKYVSLKREAFPSGTKVLPFMCDECGTAKTEEYLVLDMDKGRMPKGWLRLIDENGIMLFHCAACSKKDVIYNGVWITSKKD